MVWIVDVTGATLRLAMVQDSEKDVKESNEDQEIIYRLDLIGYLLSIKFSMELTALKRIKTSLKTLVRLKYHGIKNSHQLFIEMKVSV